MTDAAQQNLETLITEYIVRNPLGRLLDFRAEAVEPDRVVVRLPFREEVTTMGELVHGGATAALVDGAATAAAWSNVAPGGSMRGTTVGFSINFLAGGVGQDLLATAQVIRRGKTLVVVDVQVRGGDDGTDVARALVTYKLG